MKNITLSIAALGSLLFAGCTPIGGGSPRALSYLYQDSNGLTMINLFDMNGQAKGMTRRMGKAPSTRTLTVPKAEFDSLWSRLDESKLSQYSVKNKTDQFNAKDNYVISKGLMPSATINYVIPKSKAPANVREWVNSFRRKTGN